MYDINGYKKIFIDIKFIDLKKIQIYKKNIEDFFLKVFVLFDEGKMYFIVKEEIFDLKLIVLFILLF